MTVALGLLAAPSAATAQPAGKVPRIGYLWPGPRGGQPVAEDGLRQGLRELGYVEGQSIVVEYRYGENRPERIPQLIADLVQLKVDVLVALGDSVVRAAKEGAPTTPVVMVVGDPVGSGVVSSLARPGGQVTGVAITVGEGQREKWIELLRETVPGLSRVAFLWNSEDNPSRGGTVVAELQRVASRLGVTVQAFPVRRAEELDTAFDAIMRRRAGALIVAPGPLTVAHRQQIVDLANRHRLPSIYGQPYFVTAGGLMSYGASYFDAVRLAATYVDKILKGAKPADLPVQQPTKFELVVNLKTAKTLGLTIPPSVLARADEVIQ
jgi:putative ABC transport system substrate-binding protein